MTGRRDFFRHITRYLVLAVSGLTAAVLLFRRPPGRKRLNHTCPDTDPCRSCGLLNNCAVPRAQYYRRHIKTRKSK